MKYILIGLIFLTASIGATSAAAELDDWCAKVTKPSSIVICSDNGLRQLAIERTKAFGEARARLSAQAYQALSEDQNQWINKYSEACGVLQTRPVQNPIPATIVECFRREGQTRLEYIRKYGESTAGRPTPLVTPAQSDRRPDDEVRAAGRAAEAACLSRLTPTAPMQPGYYEAFMRTVEAKCITEGNAAADRARSEAAERKRAQQEEAERQAANERAERERQEATAAERKRAQQAEAEREAARASAELERQEAIAAQKARETLRAQAAAEAEARLAGKLKELGYTLVSAIDLELDWHELSAKSGKIALKGMYTEVNDLEALSVPNKDDPLVRLYSDDASREARKAMLECRVSDFAPAKCRMIVGATVITCVRNKDKLNEKQIPCLKVREVFVLSE